MTKKHQMKTGVQIFLIAIIVLLCEGCGDHQAATKDSEHAKENKPAGVIESHSVNEPQPTVTSLTADQIKTVGIAYGGIELKELTATIRANGNLNVPNNHKANVTSLYGGVVKSIHVQLGSPVRKGQVIATISNPQFIQLQEEYLTTGSQITLAEQEYSRQVEMFQNNAGAKKNLQTAETELRVLRTKRASLQKQIQLMGISPSGVSNSGLKSGLSVVAPISGTISNLIARIGSYVDATLPVAEIVDNASLHLDLNIFEKDLPLLKKGQIIHFTLTNNPVNEYDAVIFSIGSAFENDSKTIPVHAKVKGNKAGLIDGMNITGIVSLTNVLTPSVPNDAIVNADGKYYIFIVTDKKPEEHHHEDEKEHGHDDHDSEPATMENQINFEKIEVAVGVSDMGYTAITPVSNLPTNAKVVVKGAFFINAKLSNTGGHEH